MLVKERERTFEVKFNIFAIGRVSLVWSSVYYLLHFNDFRSDKVGQVIE
jgi:hypothetical protein